MKASFEDVVKATGKNFECEQSISGYYRLVCDGKIILDDSACEDVNGTEQEAFDNLPESFQESEKGERMQEYIEYMEEALSSIEESIESLNEIE